MKLLILGTGGHAKVALDIALESGIEVAGFLDDDASKVGGSIHGFPIANMIDSWRSHGSVFAMGIGNNRARQVIVERLGDEAEWLTLIHPRATVSRFAKIGQGAMICFGACIGPDAKIGDFAIVNSGATVDHDCAVGDFAHIAVGTHLAGGVQIGTGALIGAGATIIPNLAIGEWTTVGAGAAIIESIPPGATVVGVPGRTISAEIH